MKRFAVWILIACLFLSGLGSIATAAPIDESQFDMFINYHGKASNSMSHASNMEEAIRHWAFAIHEMSNGAHYLGKVRIGQNNKYSGKADVEWDKDYKEGGNGRPFMTAHVGGYRQNLIRKENTKTFTGLRIKLGDDYFSQSRRHNYFGGDWLRVIGYTLGHESGHYIYEQWDEYSSKSGTNPKSPMAGDRVALPSIMDRQYNAVPTFGVFGGNLQWLNFSTAAHYPNNSYTTVQRREHDKSSWEHFLEGLSFSPPKLPLRDIFPKLAASAPIGPFVITDNTTEALSKLSIEWLADTANIRFFLIDKSGSMQGTPLKEAKSRIAAEVDGLNNGVWVSVRAFDTVSRIVSLRQIPHDTKQAEEAKKAIRKEINAISAGGNTAIYTTVWDALDNVYEHMQGPGGYLVLITDGEDNSSRHTINQVIEKAERLGIEVRAIATGDAGLSARARLDQLAAGTSYVSAGQAVDAPTRSRELAEAIFYSEKSQSNVMLLRSATERLEKNSQKTITFPVDSTMDTLVVQAWADGETYDVSYNLLSPTGATFPLLDMGEDGALWQSFINDPSAGLWTLVIGNDLAAPINIHTFVTAHPKIGSGISIGVGNDAAGHEVTSDEPIVYSVMVMNEEGNFLTELSVNGLVQTPDNRKIPMVFYDNGDGIYTSALPNVTINGNRVQGQHKVTITASNPSGAAVETFASLAYGPPLDPDEDDWTPPVPKRITENFERIAYDYFTVDSSGIRFVNARSVSLSNRNITIKEGEGMQLTATVLPADATNKTVDWFSSDISIVTVDETGTVYGAGPGRAIVSAITADGNHEATCTVTVEAGDIPPPQIHPTGIRLSANTLTLKSGEQAVLIAEIEPDNATETTLVWETSDRNIVTLETTSGNSAFTAGATSISQSAIVKTDGVGTATITVRTANNLTATCAVTVTPTDTGTLMIDLSNLPLQRNVIRLRPGEEISYIITSNPIGASFEATGLPNGLVLTSEGSLYGSASVVGTYPVIVEATLNGETRTESFVIQVIDDGRSGSGSGGCSAGMGMFTLLSLFAVTNIGKIIRRE